MKKIIVLIVSANLLFAGKFFYEKHFFNKSVSEEKIIPENNENIIGDEKNNISLPENQEKEVKENNVQEIVKEDVSEKKETTKMLKNRDDISKEYKWNLEDIYPNWTEWDNDLSKLKTLMGEISEYKGNLNKNSETFVKFIAKDEELSRLLDRLYLYPYLQKDLDSKDEFVSVKLQEIENIYAQYSISSSWIVPEILTIPKETVELWINENPVLEPNRFPLMELYRMQEHVLSADKEKLLSYFGQYLGAPSDIYAELSISDTKWNEIKLSDGSDVVVTNAMYSKIVSTNRNQENRKKAFEALYKSFDSNVNTYGAIYRSILQKNFATSQAKNYSSSLQQKLYPNDIPVEVYTSLIESTKENTAPLQRYISLRKKILNLPEYHYYDNSINLIDYNKEFEYTEAKESVLESVKPLGEKYYSDLKTALSSGWLDVYETENKRSGAYSINIYDVHPYMLLNYNGTMDAVFTLAHELGHTVHSMLSSANQPYAISNYTIFVAEVASTFNERLLLDYMLKNTTDPKEKIALIQQAISGIVGTYYIQTLFADYEYQAHQIVEKGGAITPEILSNIMNNLFVEYFGKDMTVEELQKIIWARIPHFFNSPFYVYQYATSFASSANLYDRITNDKYSVEERNEAREKYLTLLKSGGNNYPMKQLEKAGVDLSKKETFKAVALEFDRLLDLLENELEILEKNNQ